MSALGSSLTEADVDSGLAAGATATRIVWVSASAAPGGDGSAGHPFTTIQAAVNIATPGTAVMVEAGTYVENVKFPSNAGGTAEAPIQLVSFDGQGAAKIIAADNSIATVKGLGVHDIVVKGFEIEGGLNGIQFSQSGKDFSHLVSNIVVQGNIISNTVQDGVKISQAENVRILDNTIAHTGGEGVDFVAVNGSIIARNDVSFVQGAAGIFAKGGSTDDLISGNHVHDIIKDGIEIGGWTTDAYFRPGFDSYEAKDVTVTGNDVSGVGQRTVNVLGALHSAVEGNQLAANAVYGAAIGVGAGVDRSMISAGIDIGGNVITNETHALYYVDSSSGAIAFHDNATAGTLGLTVGPQAAWASSLAQQVATAAGGAVPDPTHSSSAPVPTIDGVAIVTGTNASEILIGTAQHNALYAGGGSDYVYGSDDADTLDGGGGVDVMVGGAGDDTYVVSSAFDQIVEQAGGGHDQIFSILNTLRLGNWANVEDVTFTGTGGANIIGNDLDNRIIGGVANDSIDGGAGADTLVGSAGDDVYFVHDGRTQVVEQVGEGIDTVRSDVSFVLGANVENLLLLGPGLTGVGNDLANRINGGAGGDRLYGGGGADTLQGGDGADTLDGGTGGDSLLGGNGDDTYFIDDTRDVVIENSSGGHDTIYTSLAAYTLGGNLEDLRAASDDGVRLTGNTLNNLVAGAAGDDTLDGAAGIDTLIGGDGNDTYYVENPADQVIEAVGGGYDTVYVTNGAWVLGAGQEVEKLVAVAGTSGMALHGNAFAQTLVGNAGSNLMDGGGGADTLVGGDGGDVYVVDDSAIVIVETATGGNDIVKATVDYVLSANVETLAFQTAGHTGVGGAGANTLIGSTGSDTLDGGGGNDVLSGGGGADTFRFTPGSGNDTITDLAAGDTIDLSAYLHAGATPTVAWSAAGAVIRLSATDSILVSHVAPGALIATAGGYVMAGSSADDTAPTSSGGAAAKALNLMGTAGNDSLVGGGANDTIDGGVGVDTLVGGGGDDIYFVHDGRDLIVEGANAGTDSVRADVSFTLAANVENLLLTRAHLTGTGNDLANKITGAAGGSALYGGGGADTLLGADANDTLDGGTGADSLLGGKGDDLYVVDSTGDVVIENAGGGNDTVRTNLHAYTLAANVETLVGTSAGGQTLTGNALSNVIDGAAGADTLHGGGGNDTLAGGAGNDTYYVELSGEKVVEAAGGGYDTVYVYNGGWSLDAGQEVEKLVAAAGTAGIALHGNAFAQTLVGNAGSNLFDGGGGADTMMGGAGNDVYLVENSADVVIENAGEGTDYVQASVNYALSANVEYLTLTASGHTGKGNDIANTIVGTSGSDTLIGAGGADTLTGGAGADVFTYQHLTDRGDVITDFQVGVDRLNVHDLLAEVGGGAHLSFAHTAKGLEVYVDHGAAHDELVLLQGVAGTSLSTHDYLV